MNEPKYDPSNVPDATAPPPTEVHDMVLGGEASVPFRGAGDYGPPIASRFPKPSQRRLEVRDLEHRFRKRLAPVLPSGGRMRAPVRMLASAYQRLAMRHRSTVVDEFGRDPARAAQAQRLFEFLYRRYFRVKLVGAGNLPTHGPAMLVANRGGVLPLDVIMLMEAVRLEAGRSLRPLVEDTVLHVPGLGTALTRIGAARACRDNGERLLAQGEMIAVFPEGAKGAAKPFRERYQLKRFGRGGFAKLAHDAGAPIIPVAIVGAEEAVPTLATSNTLGRLLGLPTLPALGLVPLPSRWHIAIGEPIDPPAHGQHRDISLAAGVVRSRIGELLELALSSRGRAFSL